MDWQAYEEEIFLELQSRYPGATITKNSKIVGRSQTERQIDILVEAQVLDAPIRVIVDAKKYAKPVDIKEVESFISMMADVGAHRGILIASSGYTEGATNRAHRETNQDIELDVFTLNELKHLQGNVALPFSAPIGVLLLAPFGWVIDARPRTGAVACLYQRGYDLDDAGRAKEWMYINFWHRNDATPDLDSLLRVQGDTLSDAQLSYLPGVERKDARTLIRLAEVPGYPTSEYTGFVEFEEFIFFAVLFTSPEMSKRNLRKLREILRTVRPMHVEVNE